MHLWAYRIIVVRANERGVRPVCRVVSCRVCPKTAGRILYRRWNIPTRVCVSLSLCHTRIPNELTPDGQVGGTSEEQLGICSTCVCIRSDLYPEKSFVLRIRGGGVDRGLEYRYFRSITSASSSSFFKRHRVPVF